MMPPSVQSVAKKRNSIYRLVRQIPRGYVLSYGDVGRIVGTGPRQVAAAMRNCPVGLPWHRVVGAGGTIRTPGEYAWIQRERLMAEGVRFGGVGFAYEKYRWKIGKNSNRA
jgi:methylated-DNA-protein-cysteine methyltransferase-like protein